MTGHELRWGSTFSELVEKENGCEVPFWNPAFQSQNLPFARTPVESLRSYSEIEQRHISAVLLTWVWGCSLAFSQAHRLCLINNLNVCFLLWLNKMRWSPPPAGPLCCWVPAPEPSESSDWLPWHFLTTGGTYPPVDDPVGQKGHNSYE